MYDAIWEKGYDPYRAERDPSKLAAPNMEAIASSIGLDMGKYANDYGACAKEIQKDANDLRKVGISGTPGFFINGRYLRGAQPLPRFKALVEEELKKANERIQKGEATAEKYYQKFVFEAGKKSL
jgi:hypothetical protein